MSEISVLHTPDGLRAFIQIPPQGATGEMTPVSLRQLLNRKGIVFGIIEESLAAIAAGGIQNRIEVARGVLPKPGVPGHIQMLVDVSEMGRPKLLSDGSVDHHEIGTVIDIKKGTELARKIHPRPGIDGMNVFGKSIPAPPVEDVNLCPGVGTAVCGSDPDLLIAEVDGALGIDTDGKVEVRDEKVINGDIDYSTGNIVFSGNLSVRGTIRSGFTVETGGNLKVNGSIEDANIGCKGNLDIRGGAVGSGNGKILCKGSIRARHIENFVVEADGDVIISEDVMHSSIISGSRVRSKLIVGGNIIAIEIDADVVGSGAETKTILDVGRKQMLFQERHSLLKELVFVASEFIALKQQIFALVKDTMDENGTLSPEKEEELQELKEKIIETNNTCLKIQARVKEIERIQNSCELDPGIMIGTVFPNTFIRYGSGEKMIMDKTERFVFHPGKKSKL
ncbi:MAG: DUF342 domain-containing protein [Fibrobacter sp.]|nr:DUF342 domain-containing protein [Fibrobacter sp.]